MNFTFNENFKVRVNENNFYSIFYFLGDTDEI